MFCSVPATDNHWIGHSDGDHNGEEKEEEEKQEKWKNKGKFHREGKV